MRAIPFYENIKDAAGRFPCVPLDHRHTGYRPTRESFLATLPDSATKETDCYDEIIDRAIEAGARFGIDPISVKCIEIDITLALGGAVVSDLCQLMAFKFSKDQKAVATSEKGDLEAVTSVSISLNRIQRQLEDAAVYNYVRWAHRMLDNRKDRELCIARTKLSLEDVGPKNREILESLLTALER